METQVISRAEAKAAGLGRYYTGEVCKYGHDSGRYTGDGKCIACASERTAKHAASGESAARLRRWYAANTERRLEDNRRYREENPDRVAAMQGWHRARGYGADVPADFANASALIAATEPVYATARRLTKETGIRHEVDHVVPLSQGGQHVPSNLRVVPGWYNTAKRSRTPCQYLSDLKAGISHSSRPEEALAIAEAHCAEIGPAA